MERQSRRADIQQTNRLLKQQTSKRTKRDLFTPKTLKIRAQDWAKLSLKHFALAAFSSLATNAQLSSEQRNTKATALRLKHKTHRKPKLPRVANLLKLFVMRFFGNAKLANENITLNTRNYKRADDFL
ncbi:hypothetical protein BC490_18640 [Vibrio parahaemolyticus]|nr:hypothetical protein D042_1292 [Vibrio parahaemolyticus NIHCB0757]MCW8002371.1 hypothetical protein [Vibrio parahaemolyticus]RFD44823.1 hypothetical protein H328_000790 [Vibrio parahaemolyticus 3355]OEA31795.1 hypothetical protein BBM57_01070 [Vibrio parahaemolyticus]OEA34471.1 hypothetical protein BBM59_10250 [Vibrio parahaemolyticus]